MPRKRLTPEQQEAASEKARKTRERRKRQSLLDLLGQSARTPPVSVTGEQADSTLLKIILKARPEQQVIASGTELPP